MMSHIFNGSHYILLQTFKQLNSWLFSREIKQNQQSLEPSYHRRLLFTSEGRGEEGEGGITFKMSVGGHINFA